jgi:arylsulfatase A-like enzyme
MAVSVMRVIGLGFTFTLAVILNSVLAGCSWQGRRDPGTLVIAVENLGFDSISCEAEDFRTFCEEGVRFTHAYTTSTLSQAAMASLFTGLYPLEHGVRTNGANHLPAHLVTVAEAAAARGTRTALFSDFP